MGDNVSEPVWEEAHRLAMTRGERQYVDPDTGYRVFTEEALRKRLACCGCGCRHCPWAHEAVPMDQRSQRAIRPSALHGVMPGGPNRVLFWSGGKDSFLALRTLIRSGGSDDIVLLTTFGLPDRRIAHQELAIQQVVDQARALQLPLFGVPLPPRSDYLSVMTDALNTLASMASIRQLVFGDLHLRHIRDWREQQLAPLAKTLGANTHYPLWDVAYDALFADLLVSGVIATVCGWRRLHRRVGRSSSVVNRPLWRVW
jgi:diphthamide synthase (EF-2-diphthine--ammonia ligase)